MEPIDYIIEGERIAIEDINNIAEISNQVYEEKCCNIKLYDKPIYFSKECIEKYSMDFWHMASLENKDQKIKNSSLPYYNIKPCINTTYSKCCQNCINHDFGINVRQKRRDKCPYRMSKISLFPKIIEKANSKEGNVKIWKISENKSRNQLEERIRIRYQNGNEDYLIILKDIGTSYVFITAYPVFEYRESKDLDKEYNAKDTVIIK